MPRQAAESPTLSDVHDRLQHISLTTVAGPADAFDCTLVVDCQSQDSAPGVRRFAKIQEAVDAAAPGDVVCVRSPDHGNDRLRITRSGTLEAPIKIVAAANEPVLTAGFVIEADYVTVEGFEVRNAGAGEK